MKNAHVVIGVNYGDEGKGLMTDYLSSNMGDVAVARFNGGAQAGHTVKLSDGTSHIFHHIGSGFFNKKPTILTRFFIVNPIIFINELRNLWYTVGGRLPKTYVDPRAIVTTPFDILLNQELERKRGNDKHGSCGVGIGETVERSERGYSIVVEDLKDSDKLIDKLLYIQDEYFEDRLEELGLEVDGVFLSDLLDKFVRDSKDFVDLVKIYRDEQVFTLFDNIIFEGAQGLSLDQYSNDFPHVTRSSTGLENVSALIKDEDVNIDVYYLTRSYLTRHGAGPLVNEVENPGIVDETNIHNEWQDGLRFAPLNYERIRSNVEKDIKFLDGKEFNITSVVTHCDQHLVEHVPLSQVLSNVIIAMKSTSLIMSWGPTRNDIRIGKA